MDTDVRVSPYSFLSVKYFRQSYKEKNVYHNIFFEYRAVYDIMWQYMERPDRPQMAI